MTISQGQGWSLESLIEQLKAIVRTSGQDKVFIDKCLRDMEALKNKTLTKHDERVRRFVEDVLSALLADIHEHVRTVQENPAEQDGVGGDSTQEATNKLVLTPSILSIETTGDIQKCLEQLPGILKEMPRLAHQSQHIGWWGYCKRFWYIGAMLLGVLASCITIYAFWKNR